MMKLGEVNTISLKDVSVLFKDWNYPCISLGDERHCPCLLGKGCTIRLTLRILEIICMASWFLMVTLSS